MATLCSNCGKTLEKDDAQFCSHCGASLLSRTSKPQPSIVSQSSISSSKPPEVKSEEQNSAIVWSKVEKPKDAPQPAIRVQVVKPSEQVNTSQDVTKKSVEQNKSSIRVEVVKPSQHDQTIVKDQTVQQSPTKSVARSASSTPFLGISDQDVDPSSSVQSDVEQAKKIFEKSSSQEGVVKTNAKTPEKKGDEERKAEKSKQSTEDKKTEISFRPTRTSTADQRKKTSAVEWPAPMTHVSITERRGGEKDAVKPVVEKQPEKSAETGSTVRELYVKIREQQGETKKPEEKKSPSVLAQQAGLKDLPETPVVNTPRPSTADEIEEEPVEDRPTQLLEVKSSEEERVKNKAEQEARERSLDEIERQSTVHLPSSKPSSSSPQLQKPSVQPVVRENTPPIREQAAQVSQPVSSGGIQQQEEHSSQYQPRQDVSKNGGIQMPMTPVTPSSSTQRRGTPWKVVALLVVVLIVLGVGSWIFVAQPFNVPPVTQPQLGFSDTNLGFSLQYPNGWTSQKDAAHATVHFYDSSHTAQVNIVNADGSNIAQFMQKQVTQLGMTSTKNVAPTTFAGTTWQGEQGTVLQNGASYTCTMFVTTHNNHIVMLTQLAPQSTYKDEESVVFAALRASMKFV